MFVLNVGHPRHKCSRKTLGKSIKFILNEACLGNFLARLKCLSSVGTPSGQLLWKIFVKFTKSVLKKDTRPMSAKMELELTINNI